MVASRALELNGVASGSDGGDDTASQGGSESDTSRTDGKQHLRAGSVKKPATFKPVSFAKFAVPKAPGVVPPPKVPEKGDPGIYSMRCVRLSLLTFTQCHQLRQLLLEPRNPVHDLAWLQRPPLACATRFPRLAQVAQTLGRQARTPIKFGIKTGVCSVVM